MVRSGHQHACGHHASAGISWLAHGTQQGGDQNDVNAQPRRSSGEENALASSEEWQFAHRVWGEREELESIVQGADPAALQFQAASNGLACSQTQLAPCFYPCSLPLAAANVTLHTISSQKPGQEFPLTRNKQCSVTLKSPCCKGGWVSPHQSHNRINPLQGHSSQLCMSTQNPATSEWMACRTSRGRERFQTLASTPDQPTPLQSHRATIPI